MVTHYRLHFTVIYDDSSGWSFKITSASAAISTQRRVATGVLNQEVWTRNTTAPRPSLAKGAGVRPVLFVRSGLPLPSYLAETLQLTSSVESRRRLQSSSTSALLVPATQRTVLYSVYCNCECVITFVQCPCSIFCDSFTLIYACIIIIIIIIIRVTLSQWKPLQGHCTATLGRQRELQTETAKE